MSAVLLYGGYNFLQDMKTAMCTTINTLEVSHGIPPLERLKWERVCLADLAPGGVVALKIHAMH
jgi:hypothetical protein